MLSSNNINTAGMMNFRFLSGEKIVFNKGYYRFNLASMVCVV